MVQRIIPTTQGYKHDWSAARIMFIEGVESERDPDVVHYPTLKEVAEAQGIPYQQVRAKSLSERWKEERATAQLRLAQKRRERRVKRLADESTNFDDQSLNIAKMGQGIVAARFLEISEELRIRRPKRQEALKRLEDGEFVDPIELRSAVWFKEVSELANAATRIQELGRRALGTDVEQIAIQMDSNIEVSAEVSVRQEMERNDPERLAQVLQILQRSKIPFLEGSVEEFDGDDFDEDDEDEIVDAELVGDNTENEEVVE